MPLLRYIGFAGSALVLLLFGLSWCFPQPVSEPIRSGIGRPAIWISSVERLPERVVNQFANDRTSTDCDGFC